MSLYNWKISVFSLPISHVKKGWKCQDFLGVQGQNYCKVCMQLCIIKLHNFVANRTVWEKIESYMSQTTYIYFANQSAQC